MVDTSNLVTRELVLASGPMTSSQIQVRQRLNRLHHTFEVNGETEEAQVMSEVLLMFEDRFGPSYVGIWSDVA